MSERLAETTDTDEPSITIKEVAQSIGWLDAMASGELEFNSADWSTVAEDGEVTLEGRKGDLLVWATIKITEVSWDRDWSNDFDEDDDDDE